MNNIKQPANESFYNNLKVSPPKHMVAEAPNMLPNQALFSEKEANKKIKSIDNDIYVGTVQEKKNHEFNRNLYFKIFGGVTLATAGIAGINKIRNFFRKS